MDKNTKIALGIAVIGVGAYLIYKNKPATPASFNGRRRAYTGNIMGNRQRMMSGAKRNIVDNQTDVARPSTFNASGTVGQGKGGKFFKVQDSGWLRADGFAKG